MEGLVDNYVSMDGRDIGECIYCGKRDRPLFTEHAVPYGLNGPWTLRRASCETCARITTRFERDVMRHLWPDVRNVLAMQSRRRDKRSATLPLVLRHDGIEEIVRVPRAKFPTYLATLLFPPPASCWSSKPVKGVFANLDLIHLCGPTFREAAGDYPGVDFIGGRTNFSAEDFARMVAKIGFCAAVSALGLAPFTNTPIRRVILGSDPCIGYWVGSWWGDPINNARGGLHEIRVVCSQPGSQIHAFVRLFAQFGAPEYHVMLGQADPQFAASSAWPSSWGASQVTAGSPEDGSTTAL